MKTRFEITLDAWINVSDKHVSYWLSCLNEVVDEEDGITFNVLSLDERINKRSKMFPCSQSIRDIIKERESLNEFFIREEKRQGNLDFYWLGHSY